MSFGIAFFAFLAVLIVFGTLITFFDIRSMKSPNRLLDGILSDKRETESRIFNVGQSRVRPGVLTPDRPAIRR